MDNNWKLVDRTMQTGSTVYELMTEDGYTVASIWGGGPMETTVKRTAQVLARAPRMLELLRRHASIETVEEARAFEADVEALLEELYGPKFPAGKVRDEAV